MSNGLCVNCVKNNACIFKSQAQVLFCEEHESSGGVGLEEQPSLFNNPAATPRAEYKFPVHSVKGAAKAVNF